MEIFINGELFDYVLEVEDSFGEVVDAFILWFDGGGIVVIVFVVDGSDLLRVLSDFWCTMFLVSVGRVELSADCYEVVIIEYLVTLQTYFDSIIEVGELLLGTDVLVVVGIVFGEIDEFLDGFRILL